MNGTATAQCLNNRITGIINAGVTSHPRFSYSIYESSESMNEEIKLTARRAMAGRKISLALFTLLLGALPAFFVASGIGASSVLSLPAVRSALTELIPAAPDLPGAVIAALLIAAFAAVFSGVSQCGICTFCDLALGRRTDHRRWLRPPFIFESIKMRALMLLIKALELIMWLFIPAAVTLGGAAFALRSPLPVGVILPWAACCLALLLTGLFFYFLSTGSLVCAPYLLASGNEKNGFHAVKASLRKTKGSLGSILLFRLSFLPWFLLCAAGLPVFFVLPYYRQSMACFIFTE